MRQIVTNKLAKVRVSNSRCERAFALNVVAHCLAKFDELFLLADSQWRRRWWKKATVKSFRLSLDRMLMYTDHIPIKTS